MVVCWNSSYISCGVKGILLKKNSKKSLIALIDYIKEVKNENRNNGWNRE